MHKNTIYFLLISSFFSCESRQPNLENSPFEGKIEFEFLDSLVVESLTELYLADKNEHAQQLIFNEKQMDEIIITNLDGKIISRFKPKGDGPNQVESPLEVAFWKEGVVIKEMSPEHKLNFFDGNFKKIAQSPALTKGLNFLTIYNSHRSFSVFEKDNRSIILGMEMNLLDEQLLSENSENPSIYEGANIGYIYDVGSEDFTQISLYPHTWKPRLEHKWVGLKSSFVQVLKNDKKVAVLPSVGNQLFFYEIDNKKLSLFSQISLTHPERKGNIPFDPNSDYVLYPFFTQLFSGGSFFIIEFHTAMPQDVYDSFRSKGEDFQMNPEYWATVEKYWKAKYILTDTQGNQGAISELPISGKVHYIDANDIIYIKPISNDEKDYNVFYRYKVTLK